MARDARKRDAHQLLGIAPMGLTLEQLGDFDAFTGIMEGIKKSFGKRQRPLADTQMEARRALHWRLLHGARRERFADPAFA